MSKLLITVVFKSLEDGKILRPIRLQFLSKLIYRAKNKIKIKKLCKEHLLSMNYYFLNWHFNLSYKLFILFNRFDLDDNSPRFIIFIYILSLLYILYIITILLSVIINSPVTMSHLIYNKPHYKITKQLRSVPTPQAAYKL